MKRVVKIIFISSAVILLAAGCGKTAPQSNSRPAGQSANQPANSQPSAATPTLSAPTVTQTVDGSNLNKPSDVITAGETAFDLLNKDHQVIAKNYSGLGEFVESIDGIKPDSQHFWSLYINGKVSAVGASSYILKPGDKIEWKLETINGANQ